MSLNFARLCSVILETHFGTVVQTVGDVLIKSGPLPLHLIIVFSRVPQDKVRESLSILIQHHFVSFSSSTGYTEPTYEIHAERISYMLRYPKYLNHVSYRLGPEAAVVLEEVIKAGQVALSKLLYVMGYRTKEAMTESCPPLIEKLTSIRETFKKLINHMYIKQCPHVVQEQEPDIQVPIFEEKIVPLPDLDLRVLVSQIDKGSECSDLSEQPDAHILWQIDVKQFHLELRNAMVLAAMERKFKPFVDTRIFNIFVDLGYQKDPWHKDSAPVSFYEMKSELSRLNGGDATSRNLHEHLEIIDDDPLKIVTNVGPGQGGQWSLSMKKAIVELMWSTMEEVVVERHGYVGARIWRLIRAQKYVEQDKIHEIGMIPAKEAKHLTYKLVEDNLLCMKEIRKSYAVSAQVNKIAYVFYVDINQAVHSLLERCYKSVVNCHIRSVFQKGKHERLLIKEERIGRILSTMKLQGCSEEQLEEVRDMITPPEKTVLEKVSSETNKLISGMLHADETIFMIQMFIFYNSMK